MIRNSIQELLGFHGVFSAEETRRLLRAAGKLAMKSAKAGQARDYKSAMDVLLKAAQIEQRQATLARLLSPAGGVEEYDLAALNLSEDQLEVLDVLRNRLQGLPQPGGGATGDVGLSGTWPATAESQQGIQR